jgi:hypothetical protein
MADGHYTPFSGGHTDRKRVDDRPTLSCHHHMFEGAVSEHLRAGMNHHTSRNGMGALTYVSWCVGIDVHDACSVSSRQGIDTSPAAKLFLAPILATRLKPLTPLCLV